MSTSESAGRTAPDSPDTEDSAPCTLPLQARAHHDSLELAPPLPTGKAIPVFQYPSLFPFISRMDKYIYYTTHRTLFQFAIKILSNLCIILVFVQILPLKLKSCRRYYFESNWSSKKNR